MSKFRVYPGAKLYKKPRRLNIEVIPRRNEPSLIKQSICNDQEKSLYQESCCTGDEILCISIPCPIEIVLHGLKLRLELPCIRLTSHQNPNPPSLKPDVQKKEYSFSNSYTSTNVQTK